MPTTELTWNGNAFTGSTLYSYPYTTTSTTFAYANAANTLTYYPPFKLNSAPVPAKPPMATDEAWLRSRVKEICQLGFA